MLFLCYSALLIDFLLLLYIPVSLNSLLNHMTEWRMKDSFVNMVLIIIYKYMKQRESDKPNTSCCSHYEENLTN